MSAQPMPTLEQFLNAPLAEVRQVAPATLVFAAGGTRRSAVLAGHASDSDEYPRHARRQMTDCFDLIFQHGVQYIIAPIKTHLQTFESGRYGEKNAAWVRWGLAGEEALADYKRLGWRVRLAGAGQIPDLQEVASLLQAVSPHAEGPTVWFTAVNYPDAPLEEIFTAVRQHNVHTREEAIRAVYGEDIPPASIFFSFGKPELYYDLLPPLLIGKLQCYWRQQLGYELDQVSLRTMLYDFAYVRATWREDKTGRAEKILKYQAAWQDPPTLGLGLRLGPFWYPAPIPPPPTSENVGN